MNKNIIALAVAAGLAMPGIAAADMKIIGQAQLEVVNTSASSGSGVTEGLSMDDGSEAGNVGSGNASALGVTGSHDLGNGLTGLYKINMNFQADDADGNGLGRSRDMFIGLKGEFGAVLFGRMNSPYKTATVKWDPLLATFMQARGSNGMSTLHNGYINNTVAYANNFGSAKVVAGIAFDEADTDTPADAEYDAEHAITASLNMPVAEALELGIGFFNGQNSVLTNEVGAGAPANASNGTAVKVGLKWTSGDITVAGQYENLDKDLGDTSNLYGNVSLAMGGGATVVAALGIQTDESAGGNDDGTYMALAYKKALGKKVSAHVGLVMVDEGQLTANEDATQFGGGIRVKF